MQTAFLQGGSYDPGEEALFSPNHAEVILSRILDHAMIHYNNVIQVYAKIHKTNCEVALKSQECTQE